ncbi:MAG: hypothetical protein ACE5FL_04365 [Myxococcota bacterium]
MTLEKIVYILWDPHRRGGEELRRLLLDGCAPQLRRYGARRLQMNIADDRARVRSPAPGVPFERPMSAAVNVWLEDVEARFTLEDELRRSGFLIAGYHVEEQIYTEYGGNRHAGPRDWPDGERSPGVLAVTLMERPRRLDREEWIRRWHGRQSPMSEAMQPRSRYVRNVVIQGLTPGAPPIEGIVEEAWPSFEHVTNPFLFYGARNPFTLVKNMAIMLHSVVSFLTLWRIRTVMTSEYFIASGEAASRASDET